MSTWAFGLLQMEKDHLACLQQILKLKNRDMSSAEVAQLRASLDKVHCLQRLACILTPHSAIPLRMPASEYA